MRNVLKSVLAALAASMIFSHGLTPDPKIVIVEKPVYLKVPVSTEEKKQIDCLAKNAYFEARNQPDDGVRAITNVVLNRTRDVKTFASTPCKVIAQKVKGVCQFSWKCKRHHKKIRNDDEAWNRVYNLVAEVYLNKNIGDRSRGATYYCTKALHKKPARDLVLATKIGQHVFYKPKEMPQ